MIDWLADAIKDPLFLRLYIGLGMALMVLPMILLAVYYEVGVRRTDGGRLLMKEHSRQMRRGGDPSSALRMAKDISRGAYGEEARRLQNRTYLIVLAWLLANVVGFGALIWAQDLNKRRDAADRPGAARVR